MAENVATGALKGLGNALNLVGDRSGPAGIELALPAQPIHDLTAYVRYGSAHVFGKFNDGWVTLASQEVIVGAVFFARSVGDWSAIVSGAFGISQGKLDRMALWIYSISLEASSDASLDDIGASSFGIPVPVGMSVNSGAATKHIVFACDGRTANTVQRAALSVICVNQIRDVFPFQWAAGATATFRNQGVNAINTTNFQWSLLCRMIPMGQAPLP